MKIHSEKRMYSLIIMAIVLVWFLGATVNFARSLTSMQLAESNKKFEEIATANAAEIAFVVERYLNNLSSAVQFIEKYDDITCDEVLNGIQKIAEDNDFTRLSIDIADGPGYTSDGHVVDTQVFHYGARTRLGAPFVLDVVDALIDNAPMVSFLVPIKDKNGVYEAALRGSIATKDLTGMFDQSFVNAGGYFYVVDGSGRYVAKSASPNKLLGNEASYFEAIDQLTFEDGYSVEQIKELFTHRKSGISKYSYKDEERTSYFKPVPVNDWMVMTVVPNEIVTSSTRQHATNVILFVVQLFIMFLILICYMYTTQKNAREKALLNEKCFKALSEYTNKVVLEWDFAKNKITAMSNFEVLFGRKAITINDAKDALSVDAVHQDDREIYAKVFQTIHSGKAVDNACFRISDNNGFYHWCSLSGLVIKDKKGKPFKAIGSLENIDEQLRKENDLRLKAESDQLTGLYNKGTTETLIKDTLFGHPYEAYKYALLIIDVDNFKTVNDKLGHLYGDTVLSALSEELKLLFRTTDIVGRVGGDEFFVLVKDYHDEQLLIKKANAICSAFRKTYSSGQTVVKISASIGIAIFCEDSSDYESLYRNADLALYDTKAKGKDGYTLYNGQENQNYESIRITADVTTDCKLKTFASDPESFVFRLLYETPDTEAAITAVLRLATENFHCSRAYIFEFNPEKTLLNNTYEWCMPGITPEIDNLKDIPIESFVEGLSAMRNSGYYIIPDVSELPNGVTKELLTQQQIKSLIHGSISVNGEMQAFMGFDNCQIEHHPTESELEIITTICRMIGTFLIRMRATNAEKQTRELLLDVLSNKNKMTYVIDPETFDILYENTAIIDFAGQSILGKKCYCVFHHRTTPCADCPCHALSEHVLSNSGNIYSKKIGKSLEVVTTRIEWIGHKNAYLVRCTDLSENNQP